MPSLLNRKFQLSRGYARWYSRRIRRSGLFSMRFKHNTLLYISKNDYSATNILWKYFNAPGNVLFVTTNIVTFTGMVAYNTCVSNGKENALDENILSIQTALEKGPNTSEGISLNDYPIIDSELERYLPLRTEYPPNINAVPELDRKEVEETEMSPFKTITKEDLQLEGTARTVNFESQLAKLSIFNLLYSYYMYKSVLYNIKGRNKPNEGKFYNTFNLWHKETEEMSEQYLASEAGESSVDKIPLNGFYSLWKTNFTNSIKSFSEVQNLKLPNWRIYPKNLQKLCESLYNNDMTIIADFAEFYHELNDDKYKEVRNLLRLWLYDNMTLFKETNSKSKIFSNSSKYNLRKIKHANEIFYNELLDDSKDDITLFLKYSSIALNSQNKNRRNFMFPKLLIDSEKDNNSVTIQIDVPTISLETLLNVLDGFVRLKENKGIDCHDSIVKIISMLKKDCILSKTQDKNATMTGTRKDHVSVILLPNDLEQRVEIACQLDNKLKTINNYELMNHHDDLRKKCYRIVSTNPKAIQLLEKISQWE
ncbi:hypothetical protein TPHA_0M02060 [Tetrapisispora phaffii CBS 4417]|uniref:Uncharacterized protein n=1 Tax=Tetrapisispora phaffii (strain ATCC 24235 / CBS 4417 / NBRC 1672 / NRRL Y-8282 / UCD 70-5) TaxID=1071381 RepID=G8C0R5_TETPH|nr:hypothetical protein TPHA_0M02060 [Tetrapisispora phaffii CBS 4417]CCE65780.1 hypothetical protein TPHA_0M02060 [Tetrapisispora phaffii CBS 4417]